MKQPRIVSLHHEVLAPWADLRRQLVSPPRVIAFDFHTDTLSSTSRGIPAPAPDCWKDPAIVSQAIRNLHHDEHFDWALRAGVISYAQIISIAPQNGPYPCKNLKVERCPDLSDINILLNDPETFTIQMQKMFSGSWLKSIVQEYIQNKVSCILDIDCDFFISGTLLDFAEDSFFADLARHACLITLSCESDWVRLLRLPGETITGESIAAQLKEKLAEH